jgi:hypothetical protein
MLKTAQTQSRPFPTAHLEVGQTKTFALPAETGREVLLLVLPSTVAFQLDVIRILAGDTDLLGGFGPVPASLFIEDGDLSCLSLPEEHVGKPFSVELKNVSKEHAVVSPLALVRVTLNPEEKP